MDFYFIMITLTLDRISYLFYLLASIFGENQENEWKTDSIKIRDVLFQSTENPQRSLKLSLTLVTMTICTKKSLKLVSMSQFHCM